MEPSLRNHSKVLIKKVNANQPLQIQELLQNIEAFNKLEEGSNVCIKPNICLLKKSNTGVTTDLQLTAAIINYLKERKNCKISIVESDATINNIEIAYQALGWERLANELNVNLINLSKEKTTTLLLDGFYFKKLALPEILVNCDFFISIPKLKIHGITGITGALKNQFGCLPQKNKARYHKKIAEAIVDINRAVSPQIAIMDALVTLKGGAIFGTPEKCELVLASNDLVAIDAACAFFVGLNPQKIQHIRLSEKAGLGTTKFELLGDTHHFKPRNFKTRTVVDSLTSLILKMIGKSV